MSRIKSTIYSSSKPKVRVNKLLKSKGQRGRRRKIKLTDVKYMDPIEHTKIVSKRRELLNLLSKREMGLFDAEPTSKKQEEIMNREKQRLEELLADPAITIDDVDLHNIVGGKWHVSEAGFDYYYKRKPPLSTKARDVNKIEAPRVITTFKEKDVVEEMLKIVEDDLRVPDQLREISKSLLLDALYKLNNFGDETIEEVEENKNQNVEVKPTLIDEETYVEMKFEEFCKKKNMELVQVENEELWEMYQNANELIKEQHTHQDKLVDDMYQQFLQNRKKRVVNQVDLYILQNLTYGKEGLVSDVLGEYGANYLEFSRGETPTEVNNALLVRLSKNREKDVKQALRRTLARQAVQDPIDLKVDIIFRKFIETHPPFYSIYSFVDNSTGLFDLLKRQADRTVIDIYILNELKRRTNKFGKVPEIETFEDVHDEEELLALKMKTDAYVKRIIKHYLERDLIGKDKVVRDYLVKQRAEPCSVYRDEWNDSEARDEWEELNDAHEEELKAWDDTQEAMDDPLYELKGDVGDFKNHIDVQVTELESAIYNEYGSSTNLYLIVVATLLIALDEGHPLGKYANMFREKVKSGMYSIPGLLNATAEHLYPEILMNREVYDDEDVFFNFQDYSRVMTRMKMEDIALSYLYTYQIVVHRKELPRKFDMRDFDRYAVVPQAQCENPDAFEIPDGDLIICRREGKFYCYSRQQIATIKDDIDPYTGTPFTEEMKKTFASRDFIF